MPVRERNDPVAMDDHAEIRRHDKAAGVLTRKLADRALDLGGVGKRKHDRSHAERASCGLQRALQTGAGNVIGMENERDARHAGRNLLEQLQQLSRYGVFEKREARDGGAGLRHACDGAFPDGIDESDENDGHRRAGLRAQSPQCESAIDEHYVRFHCGKLCGVSFYAGRIGTSPTFVDAQTISYAPSESLELPPEGRHPYPPLGIVSDSHEHADALHALALLRACRERPRRRTAEHRDELAPPHSITSSARASSEGGMVMLSAFAVLRLITSSNLVGCITGRSAGFSPLRIRPT